MLPFFWHIWKYHLLNSHAANWYVQIICALELPLSYRRLKSFEVPSSSTIPTRELSIKHQTDAFHSWWTISGCSAAPSVSRFLSRFIGASVSMGNPPSWVRQCPEELGTGEGGYLARICCLGGLAVCWWVLSCNYLKVRDCRSGLTLIKPWWLWETIDFWSAFVKHCHFQSSWYHCYTCCCSGLFSSVKRKSGAGADLTLSQLQFWLLSHLHLSSLILHLILDPRFKAIWATSGFAKAPCQVSVRTSVTQGPSLL